MRPQSGITAGPPKGKTRTPIILAVAALGRIAKCKREQESFQACVCLLGMAYNGESKTSYKNHMIFNDFGGHTAKGGYRVEIRFHSFPVLPTGTTCGGVFPPWTFEAFRRSGPSCNGSGLLGMRTKGPDASHKSNASWAILEPSWVPLGGLMGALGGVLGACRGRLRTSWAVLGRSCAV